MFRGACAYRVHKPTPRPLGGALESPPRRGARMAVEMITDGRPTVDEIRDAVAEYFDAQTQNRIANTFFWNGRMVRLTDAAQRNFLFAVYSLDKTGEIDRAPFIGLLEADTDAADELGDMVAAMWTHIKECRAAGIEAKNAVDYSQYEL